MSDANTTTPAAVSTPAPRRPKKARTATLSALGISTYGENSREDAELLRALAATHPRQFWSAAKRCLSHRSGDNDYKILRAFEGHETLLRAGLALASRSSVTDGVGRNTALQLMLSMTLALPGKSEAFYAARVESARARFAKVSASEAFFTIQGPAAAGNATAALRMASLMPDAKSPNPEEARRFTYGQTSFAGSGLHDKAANALTIAIIHAEANGLAQTPRPAEEVRRATSSNPFFWIAHRHRETLAAGLPEADVWREAGCLLARRCPSIAEGDESLALALGTKPLRHALMISRPVLGSPSFYTFHRPAILLGAFQMARDDETAEIIAYANSGDRPRLALAANNAEPGSPKRFQSGLPAWALALLAGKPPDAAWMPAQGSEEALAIFKMPRAMVESAKNGSLSPSDLDHFNPGESGAAYDAARLCKELGRPWGSPPKAAKKAKA